jgi:hypothetical protein
MSESLLYTVFTTSQANGRGRGLPITPEPHGFEKPRTKTTLGIFFTLKKYIFVHCLLFLSLLYMRKLQVKNTNTGSPLAIYSLYSFLKLRHIYSYWTCNRLGTYTFTGVQVHYSTRVEILNPPDNPPRPQS